MQDPPDTAAFVIEQTPARRNTPAPSNVWLLFGEKDEAGRRRPLEKVMSDSGVDTAESLRHDARAGRRATPTRRHTMPRMAQKALDLYGSSDEIQGAGAAKSDPGQTAAPWNQAPNDRRAAEDRQTRLARTLEVDIIPRLVKVHRAHPVERVAQDNLGLRPTAQDVEDFVQLVLAREHVPAQAFIEVLLQRSMSVETVYLDLLAPAAQHLNYLWGEDLCDFTQVTIGLARMQRLLHELSPGFRSEREFRTNARRVLLMPARGEQQTFGLSMVAEFFHHAGWEVDCSSGASHEAAARLVEAEWFDVVGLSAGSETKLGNLKASIEEVRLSSRNRGIGILVGGPIFAGHPERVKFVCADASGLDGKQAPVLAERLIARRIPIR